MGKGMGRLVQYHLRTGRPLVKWLEISIAEVFIRSSQQATLPRFPQGENSFQIRNSLKWSLTKDRSRGATLIQMPLAIPTEYILYDYHLLYQWLIMDMRDELKGLYKFFLSIIDLLSSNLVVLMTWGPVHKRFSVTCGM